MHIVSNANVNVQPRPTRVPHPAIVLGGSSLAAVRRAANFADGFAPTNFSLLDDYRREMEALGEDWQATTRYALRTAIGGSTFTHLSQDPDESWRNIREQLHYVVNHYAGWASQRPGPAHHSGATPEDLLATGGYEVMTPDAAIERGKQLLSQGTRVRLSLQPMLGGIPWDEGQRSLDLVTTVVMPELREFERS